MLANTPATRTLTSKSNNAYLPLKQINGVNDKVQSITIDSKNNIYFGTGEGAFVLKHGETTPTKINGINGNIISLVVDSENNIYFGKFDGAYKLSAGSNTLTKINGINNKVNSITIDKTKYLYFGTELVHI
ncbi:hypothetical protein C6B38_02410 [Spiroplasma sp. ChiS]|uniref:hypothetical protein n=1 Tax=Spiroplasma sp. ChiS TaxID=2099885 RepID=UPI000CF8F11C|nr:hypothetical protein [Spiroplasma sp. ChiS]PQP79112.1 hypothetical protein C6B38_02410 [Spiroplasma sp. ChiS]